MVNERNAGLEPVLKICDAVNASITIVCSVDIAWEASLLAETEFMGWPLDRF